MERRREKNSEYDDTQNSTTDPDVVMLPRNILSSLDEQALDELRDRQDTSTQSTPRPLDSTRTKVPPTRESTTSQPSDFGLRSPAHSTPEPQLFSPHATPQGRLSVPIFGAMPQDSSLARSGPTNSDPPSHRHSPPSVLLDIPFQNGSRSNSPASMFMPPLNCIPVVTPNEPGTPESDQLEAELHLAPPPADDVNEESGSTIRLKSGLVSHDQLLLFKYPALNTVFVHVGLASLTTDVDSPASTSSLGNIEFRTVYTVASSPFDGIGGSALLPGSTLRPSVRSSPNSPFWLTEQLSRDLQRVITETGGFRLQRKQLAVALRLDPKGTVAKSALLAELYREALLNYHAKSKW
jgi:hypothetical protein